MDALQTIVLGMVQGLTEFIPVSSSGHLVIFQYFLFGGSDHSYLEFINIGTLLALIVFFRHKIISIVRDIFEHKNYSLALNIIITSVPAGLVGYVAADFIGSQPFFGSIVTVIVALIVVGVVMIILEKLPHLSHKQEGAQLSWKRALAIGVVQIGALIPGVSRSGSTIITGRLMGLSPAAAAEYSFLASLPIMLAVTIKLFISSSDRDYFMQHMPGLVFGNLVAFIAGMIAIKFLLGYLANHSLAVFGWYRVGLASVLTLILLLQWS
jgi:undecaprenyl-diphosphatase